MFWLRIKKIQFYCEIWKPEYVSNTRYDIKILLLCLLQFQIVVQTSFCVEVKGNVFLQDGSAIIKTTVMIIKKNNLCCVKVSFSYVHDLLHDIICQLSELFLHKIVIRSLSINLNMCFGCSKEPSH